MGLDKITFDQLVTDIQDIVKAKPIKIEVTVEADNQNCTISWRLKNCQGRREVQLEEPADPGDILERINPYIITKNYASSGVVEGHNNVRRFRIIPFYDSKLYES